MLRPRARKLAIAREAEIQPVANEIAARRRPRLRLLVAAAGAEIAGPADAGSPPWRAHDALRQETRRRRSASSADADPKAIVLIADRAVAGVPVAVGRDGKIAAAGAA